VSAPQQARVSERRASHRLARAGSASRCCRSSGCRLLRVLPLPRLPLGRAFATSWSLLSGYAGYFSFGHGAFFGAGMYTVATLTAGSACRSSPPCPWPRSWPRCWRRHRRRRLPGQAPAWRAVRFCSRSPSRSCWRRSSSHASGRRARVYLSKRAASAPRRLAHRHLLPPRPRPRRLTLAAAYTNHTLAARARPVRHPRRRGRRRGRGRVDVRVQARSVRAVGGESRASRRHPRHVT